jgi:hypothetical protein
VQLTLRSFDHERAPRGSRPVFEFDLLPHEQLVGIGLYWTTDYSSRSTIDHHVNVWVAVHLGGSEAK